MGNMRLQPQFDDKASVGWACLEWIPSLWKRGENWRSWARRSIVQGPLTCTNLHQLAPRRGFRHRPYSHGNFLSARLPVFQLDLTKFTSPFHQPQASNPHTTYYGSWEQQQWRFPPVTIPSPCRCRLFVLPKEKGEW